MKALVLFALAASAAVVSVAAADEPGLSGTWQVHQNIVGNESDSSCKFTQTGDDLAGTCDGAMGNVKISGKVSEKKVSWTIQTEYNGSPLTLKYFGTLASATKMTGTVSVDPYGVDGEFTATSAK